MESFAIYLLKSACWLTGFALIYFLFLRNERFFMLKRIYLISGILISFVFPLLSFHYMVEVPVPEISSPSLIQPGLGAITEVQKADQEELFDFRYILFLIYMGGVLLLALRMMLHFRIIVRTIKKTKVDINGPARLIRTSEFISSFSFFNYIFINPSVSETETGEIMNHELVHVNQKHWFDLLLVDILRLVQWINPFVWIYSGFIKLNHEYLADKVALEQTSNPAIYRATLVNQIFSAPVFSFSNSFSYSLNKKRFDMMKKITASPFRKLKLLLVLPVFAIIFYAFATPEYHYNVSETKTLTIDQSPAIIVNDVKGIVLKEDGTPFAGVPILVAGTTIRANTDASGNFALTDVPEKSFIVFSYKGYFTQVLKAQFRISMSVKLLKDPDYKEIVVVDYANNPPSPIKIRDINGQENALIVINGNISDRQTMESIDPSNILRINVIKGEKATDKYGEKGKDGVIEITLKRAEPLIVIDDEVTGKTMNDVTPEMSNQIATTKRLTEKEAVDKYGEKGINGAIEIMTLKRAAELGIKIPFRRRGPEDFPTFQGKSFIDFTRWVENQVKYPPEATAKGSQGYVDVEYIVETDGTVSNVKCTSAKDPLLGDAVVKVIQSSPKWEPAKNPEATERFKGSVLLRFVLPDKVVIDAEPFVVVEEMPIYPGGEVELMKFIAENTHYPDSAKVKGIQGKVIIKFMVTTEGTTEDISVLKGVHPLLDAEAERVVRLLSGFKPGYQGGKPVNVWYMVPVSFTLK